MARAGLLPRAVAAFIPKGTPLPDDVWQGRHRFILALLWLHVPAIAAFGLVRGANPVHVALEAAVPAVFALGAMRAGARRTAAATLASFGLLSCSAILVHLSGGYIEMHFHFFVMMPIISLYHDWTPFLLAIGYVAAHHGIVGTLEPASVYNHPDAIANPWGWALIHASFILGICAASVYNWRLNELAMERQVASERASARFATSLLRTASHELNTPLTPLGLQLEMLGSGQLGPLNDRQRRAVELLDRNLKRLAALVRDVLSAARLREGRLTVAREPLDLAAVAQEAAEVFDGMAAERQVRLDVDAGAPVRVLGDAKRLFQVATNLLGNALKFTPPGGRVLVEARAEGGRAVLRVRDTGRGLDGEQIARLFQPFSQAEREDTTVGTGLGLYISRGIVERHGGSIGCASDGHGKGSTFTVELPLLESGAGPAPLAPAPMAAAPEQG